MIDRRIQSLAVAASATLLGTLTASAVNSNEITSDTPIADALAAVDPAVREYNEHLTTLASPFMEGRVPGSRGMEIAKDYMEHYFREVGLLPVFDSIETAADGSEIRSPGGSYRQPFPLGGTTTITEAELAVEGAGTLLNDQDYVVTTMGGSGEVSAPITFVGYAIEDGPSGYSSFSDGDDLTGRIALVLRFEPMDDEGKSRWSDNGRWSGRAGFGTKIRSAADRNAEAIIIVNTPGADDPRVNELGVGRGGGRSSTDIPVLMVTPATANTLIGGGENGRPSIEQLRYLADSGRIAVDFNGDVSIKAKLETKSLNAENVAGLLPGRGDLADEVIIVGAHLDHLGMGYFGSRSGPGKLHPGADDNASGCAGLILFAKQLRDSYASLPDDADLQSVIFMAFSGEESGLNGSRYYVDNPVRDIEDHTLMINFDMIGRITDHRLSVTGCDTAEGLREFVTPFFDASPLDVVAPERFSGASDHSSFVRKDIPVLFGICADLHPDYHTPEDISDKINRIDAMRTITMFHDIVLAAAQRTDEWAFVAPSQGGRGGGFSNVKVRFGIMPGSYSDDEPGIGIAEVTEGGTADMAGVESGDRLVRWDGVKIDGVRSWMEMLSKHEPGDRVKIGVLRDGKEVTLTATLQER